MTNFRSRKKQVRYSESYKRSIVKEILSSETPLTLIAKRNKISLSSINRWLGKYEGEFIGILAVNQEEEEKMIKEGDESEEERLLGEESREIKIRHLEQALRLSELKNEAYERMIRIAEMEFKISIKKKSGI